MKSARAAIVLAALLVIPALAFAQEASSVPKMEFGMDLGLQYSKPSGSDGFFHIGAPTEMSETGMVAPLVLRMGFLSGGPTSFEVRLTGGLLSSSGSSGSTLYSVAPGLNVLYRLNGKRANENTYLTAGGSVDLFGISGSGTSHSYVFITFNGGIGLRSPWGEGAAKRAEAYIAYTLKNNDAGTPNIFHFGVRLGMSLLR